MSAKNVGMIESNKFPQFYYSVLAGLSGIVIGMAVGWNSPATQLITKGIASDTSYFDDNFDDTSSSPSSSSIDRDEDAIAWKTAGCYCLGTIAGGLVQSVLANAMGCRLTMVAYDAVTAVGWCIMWLIDACPTESQTVWIGRLVVGFGAGGLGLSTATYMTHAADFDIRGRVHYIHHAFVCFGVLTSYFLGTLFPYTKLIVVCMVCPVLHLFAALFLPESPCYLYKDKCRPSKVKSAMRMLKGDQFDVDSSYCALRKYMESLDTRESCCSFDTEAGAQLRKRVRRIVVAGIGLVVFQQSCGASAATFHMREVLGRLSPPGTTNGEFFKTNVPSEVMLAAIQVLSCLVSTELTEILGRKFMLIASALGMGLCLSAASIAHHMFSIVTNCTDGAAPESEWHSYLAVILFWAYMCLYSVGWGPIVMLVYSEIMYFDKWFSSLIYTCGQFAMFLAVYVFFDTNTSPQTSGNTTYEEYVLWAYAASCFASVVFVYCFVPETRKLRLNQIQAAFDDKRERNDRAPLRRVTTRK